MPRISLWVKLAVVGLVVYVGVALFVGGDVRGQKDDKDKEAKKDDKDGQTPTKAYFGIAGCQKRGCHDLPADKPLAPGDRKEVCRCNEVHFWLKHDKHATAYRVLITDEKDAEQYVKIDESRYTPNELKAMPDRDKPKDVVGRNTRAVRMEKILAETDRGKRIAAETKKAYKLINDPDCLACHAQVVPKALDDRGDKGKKDDKRTVTPSFHEEEGVNCVVCHGSYREWVKDHTPDGLGVDEWNKIPRKAKETSKGLTDLWTPERRTKLCASCHVGHQGDGKDIPKRFVSHEMYAAGHPQLPGFEIATFSNEMPRHWDYLRDKSDDSLKKQGIDRKQFGFEQTQLVLVGAATSLGESMRLLVSQADEAIKGKDILDLSNFDCDACHHGLKSKAWRQERGYGKHRPGRLPMRPWATELIKLAVEYAEPTDDARKKRIAEFETQLDAVKEAFTSRMYGKPDEIKTTAAKLAVWADKLSLDVATKAKDKPAVEKDAQALYDAIPKLYTTTDPKKWFDYDSARQVAWGFKVTYYEVKGLKWDGKPSDKDAVLTQFGAIDTKLKLRLPVAPKSIDKELDEAYKQRHEYDPAKFNELLKGLGQKLAK